MTEVIKQSKLESIPEDQEPDITHGGLVIDTDEVIIEDDTDKFITLFEKTFVEQVGETEITDSEDGAVQDILAKIVLRIKQKLKDAEADGPGVRFLRLITYFFLSILSKDCKNSTDRRPADNNFNNRRFAAAKEMVNLQGKKKHKI